jgi:hypothetical protein
MASSQSPNRVYFTSYDRQSGETNTDFTISFDTPIQNSFNYEVVSASFPNLFKSFARYETILYFYHEDFFSGSVALGIPLSPTIFAGTGETKGSRPAGREAYINERYFEDGTELATYLTAWLGSLAASWPTQASGLQPFYHQNDDPTGAVVPLASNTTGITFTNLSFTFDDFTGDGTLTMKFADSGAKVVRVASIIDTGVLSFPQPSQLGWKLGYTTLVPASFGADVVTITTANNQFNMEARIGPDTGNRTFNIPPNDYTYDGLAAKIQEIITSPSNPLASRYAGFTCTQAGGVISFNFGSPAGITLYALNFLSNPPSQQGCKSVLGFAANPNYNTTSPGGTITAPAPMTGSPSATPDDDYAPDTINLIRTNNVYFATSLSSGESLASGGRKDILFAVPLTANVGAIQLYQSTLSGIVVNRPPSTIRNVSVIMLDDNFQTLEPLPQNASVTLEIHFAYDEDAKATQTDKRSTNIYA